MTSNVKLLSCVNTQFVDNFANLLVPGEIYIFKAGSTGLTTVYSDINGFAEQTQPIRLNSRGESDNAIYADKNFSYDVIIKRGDIVIASYYGIETFNNINIEKAIDEWVLLKAPSWEYISPTSFKVLGNYIDTFTQNRECKFKVTSGDVYLTVDTSSFADDFTTVNLIPSPGVLDSSLSMILYSLINPLYPSFNASSTFSHGTKCAFYQLNPPLGWTGLNLGNMGMMRVVLEGTTGGNVTAGVSPIICDVVPEHNHSDWAGTTSSSSSGAHTHTITDPGHYHMGLTAAVWQPTINNYTFNTGAKVANPSTSTILTGNNTTGISLSLAGAHTHTINGSTNANTGTNWEPRYNKFVIGVKN